MQINIDCFKDVLAYCIDNIDYEEDADDSWTTKYVGLNTLYDAKELESYHRKDIMRSVYTLHKCGYIVVFNPTPKDQPYYNQCSIADVTMFGYKFADSVKDPTVWEQTKSIAKRLGNSTIDFLRETAHDMAVEASKEAVRAVATRMLPNI